MTILERANNGFLPNLSTTTRAIPVATT